MNKIYIAKRIPKNPPANFVLDISSAMSVQEIHKLYVDKTIPYDNHIYNGPWILRPPLSENVFSLNQIPSELQPVHIWDMVKEKIESSDIFLAIINSKSYGIIAEAGYDCKCSKLAVYILPDINISKDDLQDLWFLFQMAKDTKHLWSDRDITSIAEFSNHGINSLAEYENLIDTIVPNFMK